MCKIYRMEQWRNQEFSSNGQKAAWGSKFNGQGWLKFGQSVSFENILLGEKTIFKNFEWTIAHLPPPPPWLHQWYGVEMSRYCRYYKQEINIKVRF